MTTGVFKYMEPGTWSSSQEPFIKPWAKVDGPGYSYKLGDNKRSVQDLRSTENISAYTTDTSGFSLHRFPATEKTFTDDAAVRQSYYPNVEAALRQNLPSGKKVKKIVIFDHTIRRRVKDSPRQPVQSVHVDQTPSAAEARVRRHLPADEAEELLKGRYQIVNVWRPIENPATDFPLAVIDWRSTQPQDFIKVDLLYPKRDRDNDDDDRGKEELPDATSMESTAGYEVKGETYGVAPNDKHQFYFVKDMTPDEVLFLKCFDSRGEGLPKGVQGLARGTPHTAFQDPATPEDAPGRQSIEVRTLVFYED